MIKPQQRAYFEFTEDGTNQQHTTSRPQYTRPLSHTPRSFGNTHDDQHIGIILRSIGLSEKTAATWLVVLTIMFAEKGQRCQATLNAYVRLDPHDL